MARRGSLPVGVLAVLALLAAACAGGEGEPTTTGATTTTAAPTTTTAALTTTTTAPTTTTTTVPVTQICQVADVAGIDDGAVNQLVWEGLGQARDQLGVEILFRESAETAAYAANIESFVSAGCDLIVAVGASMAADTAAAACRWPEQSFAIVGAAPAGGAGSVWADEAGELRCGYANVRGITFATEEAAFLAGYLAAGMSRSHKVGTFGSTDLPAVTILMDAFAAGARYFGETEGPAVQVLGWDPEDPAAALFTGDEDLEQAGVMVESLAGAGVDVVLTVAGMLGRSGAAAAAESEILVVGGVGDAFLADAEFAGVWLTSLVENADAAVLDTVVNVVERGSPGGSYVGTLANGGVGLGAYHEPEWSVGAGLADAVDQLAADIAAAGGLADFLAPPPEG
jgi:basic membrane protein A